MRLAKALGMTLDDISACDEDPGDWWEKPAEQRSDLRALVFRARAIRAGETMARGAALLWELVRHGADKRDKEREAECERQAALLRENNAKVAAVLGRKLPLK
jgi:hypothetical protein